MSVIERWTVDVCPKDGIVLRTDTYGGRSS